MKVNVSKQMNNIHSEIKYWCHTYSATIYIKVNTEDHCNFEVQLDLLSAVGNKYCPTDDLWSSINKYQGLKNK
jgi:hypothetical protein